MTSDKRKLAFIITIVLGAGAIYHVLKAVSYEKDVVIFDRRSTTVYHAKLGADLGGKIDWRYWIPFAEPSPTRLVYIDRKGLLDSLISDGRRIERNEMSDSEFLSRDHLLPEDRYLVGADYVHTEETATAFIPSEWQALLAKDPRIRESVVVADVALIWADDSGIVATEVIRDALLIKAPATIVLSCKYGWLAFGELCETTDGRGMR